MIGEKIGGGVWEEYARTWGGESRSSNMYVRISWNVVKVAERAVDVSQRCMRVGDAPHGNRLAILLSDHNR